MHCRDFEQRLNDVLDQRQRPEADPWLNAHAAQCEHCAQLLTGQRALLAGLSRAATPTLGRDFARRVVNEKAMQPSRGAARRTWLALAACLASAAAMLLALSAVWYSRQSSRALAGQSSSARDSIITARPRARGFAMTQPSAKRRPAAAPPQAALTGGDLLLEAPRLPGRLRSYRVAIDDLTMALPEAVERLDEVERLAPGIRPLRVSLSMIWNTLCRTLPGSRVESPPPSRNRTSLWWLEPIRVV
jgi:HAMP domain-containing protein